MLAYLSLLLVLACLSDSCCMHPLHLPPAAMCGWLCCVVCCVVVLCFALQGRDVVREWAALGLDQHRGVPALPAHTGLLVPTAHTEGFRRAFPLLCCFFCPAWFHFLSDAHERLSTGRPLLCFFGLFLQFLLLCAGINCPCTGMPLQINARAKE